MSRASWGLSCVLVACVSLAACKKGGEEKVSAPPGTEGPKAALPAEAPKPPEGPTALLDRAIEAAGGLEALKTKLSAVTYQSEGVYMGSPYKMASHWKAPDKLVLEIDSGAMTMGWAGPECWSKYGDVVVDCMKEEVDSSKEMLAVSHAINLYALKDHDVKLEAADGIDINGKPATGIRASGGFLPVAMTLYFDQGSGLLVKSAYDGHFAARAGKIEYTYSDHKDVGGVKVPGYSVMTMDGKQVMDEKVGSAQVGQVDEGKFARPAQGAIGQAKVVPLPEQHVAVTTVTGPYDKLGAALGALFGWVGQKGLAPMGAPTFIMLKDPKSTTKPEEYVTEVQLAVATLDKFPEKEGEFEVRTVPAGEIAARLETGPYDQLGPKYGELAGWVAQNGYEIAGPAGMSCYNDPKDTPPEKLLSTIFFPVKKKI